MSLLSGEINHPVMKFCQVGSIELRVTRSERPRLPRMNRLIYRLARSLQVAKTALLSRIPSSTRAGFPRIVNLTDYKICVDRSEWIDFQALRR